VWPPPPRAGLLSRGFYFFGQTNPKRSGGRKTMWPKEPKRAQPDLRDPRQTNPSRSAEPHTIPPNEPKPAQPAVYDLGQSNPSRSSQDVTMSPNEPEAVASGEHGLGRTNPTSSCEAANSVIAGLYRFPIMLNRSMVIAGLDTSSRVYPDLRHLYNECGPRAGPRSAAIHRFRKKMDARIKSAHDGGEQRFNSSGLRSSPINDANLAKRTQAEVPSRGRFARRPYMRAGAINVVLRVGLIIKAHVSSPCQTPRKHANAGKEYPRLGAGDRFLEIFR
jgi:hypothetical protein